MSEITGGEVLARCLASEGIRFVFGLPCPEVDPLLASLEAHEIRLVPVRHEAAAVHMAEGLYKTTGAVAAVLGNPGPGSANLLPGVITARHEGVPVLVVTAQHRLGIVYPSPPSTFQGQDQLDVFRPPSSGAGRSSTGRASRKSRRWRSARCGADGPGPSTSRSRPLSSTRPATSARLASFLPSATAPRRRARVRSRSARPPR